MSDWNAQKEARYQQLKAKAGGVSSQPAITDSLLDAVKWQESRGNPNAVSPAGAQGAYQFMPATAQEVRQQLGLSGPYDPTDVAQQRQMAQHYLGQQLNQFGSPELALAAYNAGPGRVQQALKKAGEGAGWEEVSRYLPRETQKYVPSVLKKKGSTTAAANPAQGWDEQKEARYRELLSKAQGGGADSSESSGTKAAGKPVKNSKRAQRSGLSMLLAGDFSGYMDKVRSPEAQQYKNKGMKDVPEMRQITGQIGNIADVATRGYADELAGALLGDEARDLARATTSEYRQENPASAAIQGLIAASLSNPFKSAGTVKQAALRGLTEGGLYGFGAGEGGLENRAVGASMGGAFGAGMGAGAQALGNRWQGSKLQDKLTSKARGLEKKAIGLSVPKEKKIQRWSGKALKANQPSKVDSALDTLRDTKYSKVFKGKGAASPAKLSQNMDDALTKNSNEVAKLFDKATKGSGRNIKPDFKIAKRFAKSQSGTGEVDNLLSKISKIETELENGKSVKGLLELKRKIGKMGFESNPKMASQLKRQMYADIDNTIKKELSRLIKAGQLPKDAIKDWAKLNKETSAIMTIKESVEDMLFKESQKGLADILKPMIRTSGGYGTLMGGAFLADEYGLGASIPLAAALATRPGSRMGRATLARKSQSLYPQAGKFIQSASNPLIRAILGQATEGLKE